MKKSFFAVLNLVAVCAFADPDDTQQLQPCVLNTVMECARRDSECEIRTVMEYVRRDFEDVKRFLGQDNFLKGVEHFLNQLGIGTRENIDHVENPEDLCQVLRSAISQNSSLLFDVLDYRDASSPKKGYTHGRVPEFSVCDPVPVLLKEGEDSKMWVRGFLDQTSFKLEGLRCTRGYENKYLHPLPGYLVAEDRYFFDCGENYDCWLLASLGCIGLINAGLAQANLYSNEAFTEAGFPMALIRNCVLALRCVYAAQSGNVDKMMLRTGNSLKEFFLDVLGKSFSSRDSKAATFSTIDHAIAVVKLDEDSNFNFGSPNIQQKRKIVIKFGLAWAKIEKILAGLLEVNVNSMSSHDELYAKMRKEGITEGIVRYLKGEHETISWRYGELSSLRQSLNHLKSLYESMNALLNLEEEYISAPADWNKNSNEIGNQMMGKVRDFDIQDSDF